MFRLLIRLYLLTIVTYSAAIYLIPMGIIEVFHHRYMNYNLEQSRGLQSLIVRQYHSRPVERWSEVTDQLARDFAPLKVQLLHRQDARYTPAEERLLEQGKPVIRLGEWGWMEEISSPLNDQLAVKLTIPPDPLDMNLLYWTMNVLIGAALLGGLLLWLRPHWRDLERLKATAAQLGRGHLEERTHIPPSSNIGSLAAVFDTMANDIEHLLNQQRDLLNAVSHELRTPLTRLDFGLARRCPKTNRPPAANACKAWWRTSASWMSWCWSCCPTAACKTRHNCPSGWKWCWMSLSTASWAASTTNWRTPRL